jgi:hypothetical protein
VLATVWTSSVLTTSVAGASEAEPCFGPTSIVAAQHETERLGTGEFTADGKPISLDVATVARGPDFKGTWIDFERQLIHSADNTVPIEPPLEGFISDAQHAAGGYLVTLFPELISQTTRADLVFIRTDGTHHVLVDELSSNPDWEVETTGTRVAYWHRDPGSPPSLVVAQLPDGEVITEREVRYSTSIMGFAEGLVWVSWTSAWGVDTAATWDITTGTIENLPRRLRFAHEVNFAAGAVIGYPKGDYSEARVAPIDADAGWDPWTAADAGWVTFSPDGQHVVTMSGANWDENMGSVPLDFRNAHTGNLVRSFYGPAHAPPVWEDARHLLVRVHKTDHRYAYLRLSMGGGVERASRLLPYLYWPITLLDQ